MDSNKQAQRCIQVAMSCFREIGEYAVASGPGEAESIFKRGEKALTEAMARIGGTFEEEAEPSAE